MKRKIKGGNSRNSSLNSQKIETGREFWGELGANAGSTQGTHLDILEPNHLAMVLESDASFPRKVLKSALELVVGAIWIFARGIPVVEVHAEAQASVDMTGND